MFIYIRLLPWQSILVVRSSNMQNACCRAKCKMCHDDDDDDDDDRRGPAYGSSVFFSKEGN